MKKIKLKKQSFDNKNLLEDGYLYNESVALILDWHIRLVYIKKKESENIYLYGKEIYLGDTWNSTDEEIIQDFNNMTFLKFAEYYHLY